MKENVVSMEHNKEKDFMIGFIYKNMCICIYVC